MITVTKQCSNFDGVIKYQAQYPNNAVLVDNDPYDGDNFYPADGKYSNSIGTIVKNMRARKNMKAKAKSEAKVLKATAKNTQADSQKIAAANIGTSANDVALAKAVSKSSKQAKGGLSMGAKIGIGVGIAAVVGIVGYVIYKHKNK